MLRAIVCLLLLFATIKSPGQTHGKFIDDSLRKLIANDSLIIWKKNLKLTFDDFQGIPDTSSIGNAATFSFILPIYHTFPSFEFKVFAFFNRKNSWIKNEVSNKYTITHEQGHFDIAKIYAAKMQNQIEKIKVDDSIDWKIYLLYYKINMQLDSMQEMYDKETGNSRNNQKQYFWNNEIKKKIIKLLD